MTESLPETLVLSKKRKLAAIAASVITFLMLAALLSYIFLDYIKLDLFRREKWLKLPGVLGFIFCQFTIALTIAWFVFRKVAKKNDRLRDKRWVQILLSMMAGAISAIAVIMACWLFRFPLRTSLAGGILVGLSVTLAIAKDGRCRAFFQWWSKFRFLRWSFRIAVACAFWTLCLFVCFSLFENIDPGSRDKQTTVLGWAVIWINGPILWGLYRSFKQTERVWDWCFLVILIAYANSVIWLSLSETWVPTVQFLKGLLTAQFIVYAIIAGGLIIRLIKREMCLSLLFIYVVGATSPIALALFVQAVWSSYTPQEIIKQVNATGTISDWQAESLGKGQPYRRWKGIPLRLNGLTSITDEQAERISKVSNQLYLNGLTSITNKQAESLSEAKVLSLGLTSIRDEQADSLSRVEMLSLNSLNSINDPQAESLSKVEGPLFLLGLTSITDAQAESLSKVESLHISEDLQPLIDKYKKQ